VDIQREDNVSEGKMLGIPKTRKRYESISADHAGTALISLFKS